MKVLKDPHNGTKTLDNSGSQSVLAANDDRKWAIICNSSDVGLWLALGASAVIGTGIYVPPNGGSFVIDDQNLFRGAVNGVMASGSSKVIGTVELE